MLVSGQQVDLKNDWDQKDGRGSSESAFEQNEGTEYDVEE